MNILYICWKKNKSKAFTLAEVLLTLTLVGVVATLTIPPLMNNIQGASNRVAFKETISILNQSLQKMNAKSTPLSSCFIPSDHNQFANCFKSELIVSRECDPSFYPTCFPGPLSWGWENGKSLVLANGVSILFYAYNQNCNITGINGVWEAGDSCGEAFVDVNGPSPPNTSLDNVWEEDEEKCKSIDRYWVEFSDSRVYISTGGCAKYMLKK